MRAPPCPVYNTAKRSGKAGFKLTLGVVKWLAEAPNQTRRDKSMNPAPMSLYYDVSRVVAPKRIALAGAEEAAAETQAQLAEKKEKLAEVVAKLEEITQQYKNIVKEKDQLEREYNECLRRMDLAQKLIGEDEVGDVDAAGPKAELHACPQVQATAQAQVVRGLSHELNAVQRTSPCLFVAQQKPKPHPLVEGGAIVGQMKSRESLGQCRPLGTVQGGQPRLA